MPMKGLITGSRACAWSAGQTGPMMHDASVAQLLRPPPADRWQEARAVERGRGQSPKTRFNKLSLLLSGREQRQTWMDTLLCFELLRATLLYDFKLVAQVLVVGYFYDFIRVTLIQASFFTGTIME